MMSRLKDQMIEEEAKFWHKAKSLISSCENFNLYNCTIMSLAPKFLINSPSSIRNLQEQLLEGWNEYWSKYNA
jgi:hypothetical protein